MSSIHSLLARVRYALEPEEEAIREELLPEMSRILDSVRYTLQALSEDDRERLVEEIEAAALMKDGAENNRPHLFVVGG